MDVTSLIHAYDGVSLFQYLSYLHMYYYFTVLRYVNIQLLLLCLF